MGTRISASPISGARLETTSVSPLKAKRTPLDSSLVRRAARRMAVARSAASKVTRLSWSLGMTSSKGGKVPSTRLVTSMPVPSTWKTACPSALPMVTFASGSPSILTRMLRLFDGTMSVMSPSPVQPPAATARRLPSVPTRRMRLPLRSMSTPLIAKRAFSTAVAKMVRATSRRMVSAVASKAPVGCGSRPAG